MSRKKSSVSLVCPHYSVESCKYESYKKCPYAKETCLKAAGRKKRIIGRNSWPAIALFLLGMVLIFVSKTISFCGYSIINELFSALGISLIVSVVLTVALDFPNKIEEFKNIIIEAHTSNDYLKRLNDEQLSAVRMEVTHLLHQKDVPNMPKTLIHFDQEICNLLKKPYYKYFREDTNCSVADDVPDDGEYIRKNVTCKYEIYNPYNKDHQSVADIGLYKQLIRIQQNESKKYFRIKRFDVKVDSFEMCSIMDMIEVVEFELDTKSQLYDCGCYLRKKGDIDNDNTLKYVKFKDGGAGKCSDVAVAKLAENQNESKFFPLYVEFYDKIVVHLEYEIIVPKNDRQYTMRLRLPAKSFRVDYQTECPGTQLCGQLFGTLIDETKIMKSISTDKKRLAFETLDWMLPKNGVSIVLYDIVKKGKQNS